MRAKWYRSSSNQAAFAAVRCPSSSCGVEVYPQPQISARCFSKTWTNHASSRMRSHTRARTRVREGAVESCRCGGSASDASGIPPPASGHLFATRKHSRVSRSSCTRPKTVWPLGAGYKRFEKRSETSSMRLPLLSPRAGLTWTRRRLTHVPGHPRPSASGADASPFLGLGRMGLCAPARY
jgi:hypothetical protein